MQKIVEIGAERSPDEKTWDMINGIAHEEHVVREIIRRMKKHEPFSDAEEAELIEAVEDEIKDGMIVIPGKSFFSGRDIFNPNEYKWGDVVYALHKSYDYLFIASYKPNQKVI